MMRSLGNGAERGAVDFDVENIRPDVYFFYTQLPGDRRLSSVGVKHRSDLLMIN